METRNVNSERRFSAEKMQKVNLFETERMFADIYCLEPGQEQRRHAHSGADKIYFVIEGTGRFHIGEDERDLGADRSCSRRRMLNTACATSPRLGSCFLFLWRRIQTRDRFPVNQLAALNSGIRGSAPGSAGIPACMTLRAKRQAGMPALPGALPGQGSHREELWHSQSSPPQEATCA